MDKVTQFIELFKEKRIMVIGDVIADEFINGVPERLSREAPVLILKHQSRQISPGGCANAANNIASLGGKVNLVGVIGDDDSGRLLNAELHKKGISTDGLMVSKERPTSLKTRVIAGGNQIVKQQVIRIDYLDNSPINPHIEDKVLNYVKDNIKNIDAVVLSDYGLGVFTQRIKKEVIGVAGDYDKIVVVDSRYSLLDYQGVTIATPNLEEASASLGYSLKNQEDVVKAGRELLLKLSAEYLLITLGGDGMTVFTAAGEYKHIPVANYSEVFDVTGAGDTVVGVISLALSSGVDIFGAVELANYAAGIVVRKAGVATVNTAELIGEVKKR